MAWKRKGYYYRSRKVNGRVVHDYLGKGKIAELEARLDTIQREKRLLDAEMTKIEQVELETVESDIQTLFKMAELVTSAALLSAGYHQHHRGEWRRRRVPSDM
jgi:hypothetical protein